MIETEINIQFHISIRGITNDWILFAIKTIFFSMNHLTLFNY